MSEPLACHEGTGPFPEYVRILDAGNGEIEFVVSEIGLLSPVAKIKLPLHAAKCLLFDAAHRVEDLYEDSKL